jgi:uncharacterized protein YPO0396
MDGMRDDLNARIDATNSRMDGMRNDLTTRMDNLHKEQTTRIDNVADKLDALKDSLASAKIWALVLYIALAGSMFTVLARGFKWI